MYRKGKWGGLITAAYLGKMLGCSTIQAKRILYSKQKYDGDYLEPAELTEIIFYYRLRREIKNLEKLDINSPMFNAYLDRL